MSDDSLSVELIEAIADALDKRQTYLALVDRRCCRTRREREADTTDARETTEYSEYENAADFVLDARPSPMVD
jgi:hypothetical protein